MAQLKATTINGNLTLTGNINNYSAETLTISANEVNLAAPTIVDDDLSVMGLIRGNSEGLLQLYSENQIMIESSDTYHNSIAVLDIGASQGEPYFLMRTASNPDSDDLIAEIYGDPYELLLKSNTNLLLNAEHGQKFNITGPLRVNTNGDGTTSSNYLEMNSTFTNNDNSITYWSRKTNINYPTVYKGRVEFDNNGISIKAKAIDGNNGNIILNSNTATYKPITGSTLYEEYVPSGTSLIVGSNGVTINSGGSGSGSNFIFDSLGITVSGSSNKSVTANGYFGSQSTRPYSSNTIFDFKDSSATATNLISTAGGQGTLGWPLTVSSAILTLPDSSASVNTGLLLSGAGIVIITSASAGNNTNISGTSGSLYFVTGPTVSNNGKESFNDSYAPMAETLISQITSGWSDDYEKYKLGNTLSNGKHYLTVSLGYQALNTEKIHTGHFKYIRVTYIKTTR